MDINRIGNNANVNIQKIQKEIQNNKTSKKLDNKDIFQAEGNSKKYLELASRLPEVRTKLVNELKSAIENGAYDIDAEKISKKMLGGL
ncbi:MAG: flagellar biosynthesis anti-sigma factor FlgM [Thermotogota bacterium]